MRFKFAAPIQVRIINPEEYIYLRSSRIATANCLFTVHMSVPPNPNPETHSALKHRINALEEENERLLNRMVKKPYGTVTLLLARISYLILLSIHSYIHDGQAIRRLVNLVDPISDLIAEYDRRVILVEDVDEIEHVAATDE